MMDPENGWHWAAVGGVIAIGGTVVALLLSACTDPQNVPASGGLPEKHVTLSDGRTVICITSLGTNGGVGISCDWQNARRNP